MRVINERNYPQVLQEVEAVLRAVNNSLKRNGASASEIVALNLALKYLKTAIDVNIKVARDAKKSQRKSDKTPYYLRKIQEAEDKKVKLLKPQIEEMETNEEEGSPL